MNHSVDSESSRKKNEKLVQNQAVKNILKTLAYVKGPCKLSGFSKEHITDTFYYLGTFKYARDNRDLLGKLRKA